MSEADRKYEVAVYSDDVLEYSQDVLDALAPALVIPDRRVCAAMVAAALISAVEFIDGPGRKGDVVEALMALIATKGWKHQ